jgi:EmrB/QacA subfamily drug resistance transporter
VQWTIDGYLLTLSALLLVGGSLGDVFGRRRVFSIGLAAFALTSLLCGLAPTIGTLIAARALQGAAAALLVPGSLALLASSFQNVDRGRAIGAWSGLAGITTAIGPFLGGWLVDAVSWRLVFLINPPIAVVALAVTRGIPESRDPTPRRPDVEGGLLAASSLGGLVFLLIQGSSGGFVRPAPLIAGAVGLVSLVAFGLVEQRRADPMLPFALFRDRQFSGTNVTTLAVYFALGGAVFLLVLRLQDTLGYSALEAGAALVPLTVLLLLLSSTAGRIASRTGPRLPMTVGSIVAGAGVALLALARPGASFAAGVLPGVLVLGLGMAIIVAPLTTAVLAAATDRNAGIASAANNAVARLAGLLAVAVLPVVARRSGFGVAMIAAGALCAAGGVVAALTVRPRPPRMAPAPAPAPPPARP